MIWSHKSERNKERVIQHNLVCCVYTHKSSCPQCGYLCCPSGHDAFNGVSNKLVIFLSSCGCLVLGPEPVEAMSAVQLYSVHSQMSRCPQWWYLTILSAFFCIFLLLLSVSLSSVTPPNWALVYVWNPTGHAVHSSDI